MKPTDQPKIKPIDQDDLQALYDNAEPRQTGGTTVRGRRRKEKRGIKSTDGRLARSKGRDKQFGTNLTPELFDRMEDICERFDLTKVEFTELAFKAAIAVLKAAGVEALQKAGEGSDGA